MVLVLEETGNSHDVPIICSSVYEIVLFSSRFWKISITCRSYYNAELKIWSCESWTCLQSLSFVPNPNSLTPQLFLKARLDMTGQYLLLSDINNRIIYTSSSDDLCLCEANEDETNISAVVIKMYVVQPKRLQECNITFQTDGLLAINPSPLYTLDSPTDTLINLNENKNDENENTSNNSELTKLNDLHSSVNYLIQQQSNQSSLNLMTPDAFTSPIDASPTGKRNSHGSELTSPVLKPEKVIINEEPKVENLMDADDVLQFQRPLKDNFAIAVQVLAVKYKRFFHLKIVKNISITLLNRHDGVWPNIPIMKANEIVQEENRKLAAAENIVSENRSDISIEKSHLQEMDLRLSSLESIILEQNSQIQKLHHEVKSLTQDFKNVALSRSQIQQAKLFENYVNIQKSVEQEHIENLIASTTQILTKQITDKLQIIVAHELKNIVLPSILNTFEKFKASIGCGIFTKIKQHRPSIEG
ncbi:hypothetical protein FQA39_LY19032 [Lamprigera yunnana]|nr:hypothetical protein FQA39_LY19032 [Lamprigera yunnana]